MRFIIEGKFKPYVRMTQRSKWVDPQAQEYIERQAPLTTGTIQEPDPTMSKDVAITFDALPSEQ